MSFITQTRERTRPGLPLTALVDVLFLMLIFFVAAPALDGRSAAPDDMPAAPEQRHDSDTPSDENASTDAS